MYFANRDESDLMGMTPLIRASPFLEKFVLQVNTGWKSYLRDMGGQLDFVIICNFRCLIEETYQTGDIWSCENSSSIVILFMASLV